MMVARLGSNAMLFFGGSRATALIWINRSATAPRVSRDRGHTDLRIKVLVGIVSQYGASVRAATERAAEARRS